MSLYTVTIEDRIYQVSISGDHCTVNGEKVDARVLSLNRNGLHVLHRGKQATEVFLSNQEADTYQMFMLGGRRIVTQITARVKKHLKAEEDGNTASLVAPMHGLVVDVPVHVGDTVDKGQTLVVLESMKMQMQLRSPRAGKVAKVTVQPGVQVEKGAFLVQFE
ncbi:MAG: biotin/lipoyl-containing protein [Anaerolineales bacterium]